MNKRNIIIAVVSIVVLFGINLFIKRLLPIPMVEIVFKPEVIGYLGPIPMTNTMLTLWVSSALLLLVGFLAARKPQVIPGRLQNAFEMIYDFWDDQAIQFLGKEYARKWLPLVSGYFLIIIFAAYVQFFIPIVDTVGQLHCGFDEGYRVAWTGGAEGKGLGMIVEKIEDADGKACKMAPILRLPGTDLNFTLALAIMAFCVIEYMGFKVHGPRYITKFFHIDFKRGIGQGLLNFFVGLIELISEFARIISFCFRLFGNMFAGAVLIPVILFLMPLLFVMPFMLLELFVGLIQAFVFAILILAFMMLALEPLHEGVESEQ